MLVEVLLARESLARVSLAVGMGTVNRVLGTAVLAMNFTLVSQETS